MGVGCREAADTWRGSIKVCFSSVGAFLTFICQMWEGGIPPTVTLLLKPPSLALCLSV